MNEYDHIARIIDKEIITLSELREIANNILVATVTSEKPDNKHPNCQKFKVKFENEEIYWVYVKNKKPLFK